MLTSLQIYNQLILAIRLPAMDKLKPCVVLTQGFKVNDRIKRIELYVKCALPHT